MTSHFILHLGRFGDLILKAGPERLYAAPLVTPEDSWFPDRWTPDLESVRRILLRLAEYAGMPDLDVEVAAFPEEAAESRIPESVMEHWARAHTLATFIGLHDGCAWFGIEEGQLQSPQRMIGVLAHEMAHAWREVHDIHVTHHNVEEECTDMTAILLGFGILLCNSACEYQAEPRWLGGYAETKSAQTVTGYLAVDDMAGLLACWAKLKGMPEKAILQRLGSMQADGFREASAQWSEDGIHDRLGIPADSQPDEEVQSGASRREFKRSQAARSVHETVERIVAAVGEDGGLLSEPIPFPVPVLALPHRTLGSWGRISAAGIWARTLALVSDPEWDTQAIVLVASTGEEMKRHAVGHVRDRDARDAHRLHDLLVRAFRRDSPLRSLVAPQLPTFVRAMEFAGPLGEPPVESLIRTVADEADPAEVAREADWLVLYKRHTLRRLEFERAHGGMAHPPSTGSTGSKRWLRVVSEPAHVEDEIQGVPWFGALLQPQAGEDPAPPGADG